MSIISEELRVALIEFKSSINSFNFVINYEEPPYPIGSIESYQAQLELANEYLKKYPELNSEEFNSIGLPLAVKTRMLNLVEIEKSKSNHQEQPSMKELLWDTYMILDHGDSVERLEMLDKLENYFSTFGKPNNR